MKNTQTVNFFVPSKFAFAGAKKVDKRRKTARR